MNSTDLTKTTITIALFMLMASDVHAMAPDDVDDLVGARASSGESQLQDRGYHYRKTVKVSDNSISYWWNSRKRACIAVTTADGRYKSIMTQPEAVCGGEDKDSDTYHGDKSDEHRHRRSGHRDIDDLVGMRASSGERELEDRGYKLKNTQKGSDRIWSNWWNASDRKCITVVTMDGRYDSVTDTLPADCEKYGSSAGAEAPPDGYGKRVPQIMKVDDGNLSVDMGGCTVLFNPDGDIVNQGASCSKGDLGGAKNAFNAYRREQSAPADAEAPPGGFGAP